MNRRRAILIVCCGTAVIGFAVFKGRLAGHVKDTLLPEWGAARGLQVSAEDVSISLLFGSAKIEGLVVRAKDQDVLRAGTLSIDATLSSLGGDRPVLDEVVLSDATLRVLVLPDGTTTLDTILEGDPDAKGPGASLLIRSLRANRCRAILVDPKRVRSGHAADLAEIEIAGKNLQFGPQQDASLVATLDLDGSLRQTGGAAPVSLVAWSAPSTVSAQASSTPPEPTFVAHAAVTDLDVNSFAAYVDETQRRLLGVERIDIVGSMDVKDGMIRKGAVVGCVPGRAAPLTVRFGGRLSDPTVDASGSLAALFELPFARAGHLGRVVWDTGGALLGGAGGAIECLAKGDVIGAGKSVVSGAMDTVRSAGSGVLGTLRGLGSAVGLGPKPESGSRGAPRDAAALHATVRAELHAARDAALSAR